MREKGEQDGACILSQNGAREKRPMEDELG